MSLPDPFVPADTDISGFDSFMFDVQKLFSSELWALSTGDEFKAAVSLWGKAWTQSPPGSLPNDDRVLAAFSGAGSKWKKVRTMALRGFVECSDGRLYHRTLCDDVLRAAKSKQDRRERTAKATEARRQKSEENQGSEPFPAQRNDERNDERDVGHMTDVTFTHNRDVTGRDVKEEKNKKGAVLELVHSVMSKDWSPSEDDRQYARDHGLSEQRIDKLAEQHRDYWLTEGIPKADWSACWRFAVREKGQEPPAKTAPGISKDRDLRNVPDSKLSNDDFWRKQKQLREWRA